MATQSSDPELPVGKISVEEYLKSMYHPDCDYVDGEFSNETSLIKITARRKAGCCI